MKGNDDILNSYCMPGPELGCLLSCSPSLGSGYCRGPHVMEEERIREAESVIQLVSSGAGMRTQNFLTPNLYSLPSTQLTGFQILLPRIYQDSTLGLFSLVTELSQAFLHNAKFELKGHGTDEDTEASSR